ncbi:hypothetical protein EDC94DRAFT_579996 [Helicostylum pulchrum]|nr:hypothetical protein EDC94DRAFT_579996 [Helicostylum pulchrum]
MKLSGTTLRYCEVKPADAQHDVDSLCTYLIRLAIFSCSIMSRKDNKIACSLQAVGHITPCTMQIKELGNLNTITDELKQMSKIYDNYCLKRYVSDIKDDDTNIASILKKACSRYYTYNLQLNIFI